MTQVIDSLVVLNVGSKGPPPFELPPIGLGLPPFGLTPIGRGLPLGHLFRVMRRHDMTK